MYHLTERNKAISPHKAIQAKRISQFIKVLKSFDESKRNQKINANSHKIKYKFNSIQEPQLFINIPRKKTSLPNVKTYQTHISQMNTNENISTISKQSKHSGRKISLPSINLDIYFPTKNHTPSSHRIRTQPTSNSSHKLDKIFFSKVQGLPNGNLLQYLRKKPTQKYFSKRQNVRLAQKLLLMQPSKGLRKCEHEKFYQQQKTYRQKISHGSQMKKIDRLSILQIKRSRKYNHSEWIN